MIHKIWSYEELSDEQEFEHEQGFVTVEMYYEIQQKNVQLRDFIKEMISYVGVPYWEEKASHILKEGKNNEI